VADLPELPYAPPAAVQAAYRCISGDATPDEANELERRWPAKVWGAAIKHALAQGAEEAGRL